MRKWKVIDRGAVPDDAPEVPYLCMACETESLLPVVGVPIAQVGYGIVFDLGVHAMPKVIQCRKCRKFYESCDE